MKNASPRRAQRSVRGSDGKSVIPAKAGIQGLFSSLRSLLPLRGLRGEKSFSVRAQGAHEAASAGRRLRLWQPGMYGPNSAVLWDLTTLRNRSRDLVRNNPWISRGIESFVANSIGCGITFRAQSPNADFNTAADELWEQQVQYFDADGLLDFHGMLAQIVRTRLAAGEIFIRRRVRRNDGSLPVPLQYQLLEPEFCPHTETGTPTFPGRQVKAGIEFRGDGKRTAYFMYRSHPGDFFVSQVNDLQLVPVPASEILHHYSVLRPGQIRGIPAIVQAMIKAKDFDEYSDSELVRKKTRSSFAGMVTRPDWGEGEFQYDPFSGEPLDKDTQNVGITQVEPGQFFLGNPGEGIELFEGDNTGSGFTDFIRHQLLGIAAGLSVPAEFVSGDFSNLNDRTLRVVLAEYRRMLEQDRWQLIPAICYPIWRDFVDLAILSGALPEPADFSTNREKYLKVMCAPEGFAYLHELQDANADAARLKAGLTSRKRIAAEAGEDIREIDAERAEDAKRSQQLGLTEDFGSGGANDAQKSNSDDRASGNE